MFLIVGIVLIVLAGAFVAGALSRLTKPRSVAFKAKVQSQEVSRSPFEAARPTWFEPWFERGPQVWEQNLVGIDAKPKAKQSMGNWD
jgi:hypothetical protein